MVQILEVVRAFRAKKIFRNIIQIFQISKISHEIYAISHKIVIICPIFLYNKTILPDCGANIARLALFAQQTGWSGANPCIKDHFNGIRKIREIFKTNRETWRSARKPGNSRLNRETWQLWIVQRGNRHLDNLNFCVTRSTQVPRATQNLPASAVAEIS